MTPWYASRDMKSGRGCPLRGGTPDLFAELRNLLLQSGFTEEGVFARLGIGALPEFVSLRSGREPRPLEDKLDLFIRLFMDEECVDAGDLRRLLPPGALATMEALGVISAMDGGPPRLFATVSLCPAGSLYIAADRCRHPDAAPFTPQPDVVYPVSDQTLRFLDSLPPLPCGRLLDLGTGTGIAAIHAAAGYAGHARATDVTARSAAFAEFNRQLNGIPNVTVAQGNLYEAAAGETFDRIVAHPPYVPVPASTFVFRDGGEDGEQVLRGIVEGLPRHLAPGGRFYGFGMASDREGEFLEQRIRRWLGGAEGEFDVLLAANATLTPDNVKSPRGEEEREHWRRVVESCRVTHFFYGSMLLERHAAPRPAYTVRTQKGPRTGWREVEWLRGWMTASSGEGFDERMLASRPRLSPRLELRSVHHVLNGRLAPRDCALATDYPFDSECACQPWLAQAVAGCDGSVTVREYYARCAERGLLRAATSQAEFARALAAMTSAGFLELPEFELPESSGR